MKSKNMGQVHNAYFLPCNNAGGWNSDPYVSFLRRNSSAEISCFCSTLHYWRAYPTKSFIHSLMGFSSGLSFTLTVPASYVCHIYSQFPWLCDLPSDC